MSPSSQVFTLYLFKTPGTRDRTEGYLNQLLLLVDTVAAYVRMTPESRSINASAMVAKSERDFDEIAA